MNKKNKNNSWYSQCWRRKWTSIFCDHRITKWNEFCNWFGNSVKAKLKEVEKDFGNFFQLNIYICSSNSDNE